MDAVLLLLTTLGTACAASRLARRGPLTLADLVIGVVGALVGLELARLLDGSAWGLALPLLLAFMLTLGLESLQRRSLLR